MILHQANPLPIAYILQQRLGLGPLDLTLNPITLANTTGSLRNVTLVVITPLS